MIISKTPFRISFLGGGTDIPWFYEEHGGTVFSTAINKHMFISAHEMFGRQGILLKYSQTELVKDKSEIKHPIFRAVFEKYGLEGLDVSVSADIPSGTGLGSSSAFTVGLLRLVHDYMGLEHSINELAEEACDVEIRMLGEKIGKQDQFASAFGGLNRFRFSSKGSETLPINLNQEASDWLNESMVLVSVGKPGRSTNKILGEQEQLAKRDKSKVEALVELKTLTEYAIDEVLKDIEALPALVSEGWELKKRSNPFCSNDQIDDLISFGMANGSSGSKLLGAGQSGFVLFFVPPDRRDSFMSLFSAQVAMPVRCENQPSHVIYNDQTEVF